jgi:hypothetical protein
VHRCVFPLQAAIPRAELIGHLAGAGKLADVLASCECALTAFLHAVDISAYMNPVTPMLVSQRLCKQHQKYRVFRSCRRPGTLPQTPPPSRTTSP